VDDSRTIFQPATAGSVRPGTRLNGIYEIETLIAQGGMGEVYRGFNIQTRDIVAIKMIRPELSNNTEVFDLFRREASILHTLQHEAIVRYFVFSVDPQLRRAYLRHGIRRWSVAGQQACIGPAVSG
jgi:serine/threonine-protein kinase